MVLYLHLNYLYTGMESELHFGWLHVLMSEEALGVELEEHTFYCCFVNKVTFVKLFHSY